MLKYDTKLDESQNLTEGFLRQVVEVLSPAVADCIARKSSGSFEVHFQKGQYKLTKRNDTL